MVHGIEPNPDPIVTDGRTEFGFTFGDSHTQSSWGDTRRVSWPRMVEILTSHVPGIKEGSCVVPAIFAGDRRKKEEAAQIDVAFLDSDSGATLDDIRSALTDHGWEAVVSSTHSHMSTMTAVGQTNWNRFFVKFPDATPAEFLLAEKGYLAAVCEGAEVVETDDTHVFVKHGQCPKFRIALPLSRPWRAADYPSQAAANEAWKERIEALASALNLSHDQACTDTSRLFYLPRRPPNGAVPETAVVGGSFCDIFALPAAANAGDLFNTPHVNGHAAPVDNLGPLEYADPVTGEFVDLATWAKANGRTFLIARALKARKPGCFVGLEVESKVHIDCPNGGAHTDPGRDNATYVVNAGNGRTEGFVAHCRHGHCTGKDRLFFVRKMLEERWLSIGDLTSPDFQIKPDPAPGEAEPQPSIPLIATSLASLDLDNIPPRRWIYGRELVRNYVSVLAGPGGAGKTAYTMAAGVAVVCGRPLLAPANVDKTPAHCVVHKTGNVWFFNLEDPMEEMRRRIKATLQHHKIPVRDVADRIFIDSGRDTELIIAIRNRQGGELVASPIMEPLVAELKARKISVLIVDPFVQSHAAEENRNEEMNLVMALWGKVATRADCAVWLVHHFRKGGKGGDAESIRGAGAIQGAARSMFTVSSMTPEEASKLGVDEDKRWQYIRHDNAKQNMAPPAGVADWYRLASVALDNGTDEYPEGDFVQAVEAWSPPSPWDGLPWTMIERVLVKIDEGPGDGEFYALGKQSKDRWAGRVLMDDACKTEGQSAAILKAWKESGVVEEGQYSSPKQKGGTTGCIRVNQTKLSEMRRTFSTRTLDDE